MNADPDNLRPPKLVNKFLTRFLRDELAEEVQGDLEVQFRDNLERLSAFRAKLKYWLQVLNYLRPFAIRNLCSILINLNRPIVIVLSLN
jgi:putative ABC transport system permease protein